MDKFFATQAGQVFFRILATVAVGFVVFVISKQVLVVFFDNLKQKSGLKSYQKRLDTLKSLLGNVFSVAFLLVIALMIMKDLGFDITPILTGAGILGLAVSFGSQSLVKDLISGFFIILENQFNVGDEVKIDGIQGRVYKINLRTTILKDEEGNLIYLPNSSISKLTRLKKEKK